MQLLFVLHSVGTLTLGTRCMSPREVAKLQHQIEIERKSLQEKTGLAQEERDKAANELEKRESEILKAQ